MPSMAITSPSPATAGPCRSAVAIPLTKADLPMLQISPLRTARLAPAYDVDEGLERYDADTTRLWISDRQWMAILQDVEASSAADSDDDAGPHDPYRFVGGTGRATGDRSHARHAAPFRCLLRLAPADQPHADHGTYLVFCRNISAGGMGFVHTAPLHPGTRCTAALQPAQGHGSIIAARVAWSRAIDRDAEDTLRYDIGLEFDQPLDISPYTPAA